MPVLVVVDAVEFVVVVVEVVVVDDFLAVMGVVVDIEVTLVVSAALVFEFVDKIAFISAVLVIIDDDVLCLFLVGGHSDVTTFLIL